MSNQRFQLVFFGAACDGYELDRIKTAIAERFKLDQDAVEYLFSKPAVVVKRNLDAETAIVYKRVIDRLGGLARIEAMPLTPETVKEAWFVERRSAHRRFHKERRKSARVWMYRSERRRNKGRRVGDV